MSVRIRFSHVGRPHAPFFRLVATDRRKARDGKPIEVLGTFNPLKGKKAEALKIDRIRYWISQGATMSDSVRTTLKNQGFWSQIKASTPAKS